MEERLFGASIHLNTSTFGRTDARVRGAVREFEDCRQYSDFPLAAYTAGRDLKREAARLALQLWKADAVALSASAGGSEAYLRISWLIQESPEFAGQPIRVVMPLHEHEGARVPFTEGSRFKVRYLPDDCLSDPGKIAEFIFEHETQVVLISEIFYDDCRQLPMAEILKQLQNRGFGGIFLLDAAQSAGHLPTLTDTTPFSFPIFQSFSLAKWLQGPWGTSATLCNRAAVEWLRMHPRRFANAFDPESPTALLEPTGAQDFAKYAGMVALFQRELSGPEPEKLTVESRIQFADELVSHFTMKGIPLKRSGESGARLFSFLFETSGPAMWDPYPLYVKLNERGLHIKCIKKTLENGERLWALRWSLGRHVTAQDLRFASIEVKSALDGGQLP